MSTFVSFSRPKAVSLTNIMPASNILDVPEFFWNSEPTLHPLYFAVREYLEITPRIKVLNERCSVFLELATILSESIADTKMSNITWIVIILIVLSIIVTVSEVGLRFGLLTKEKENGSPSICALSRLGVNNVVGGGSSHNITKIRAKLSDDDMQQLCGMSIIGQTYKEL